MSCRSNRYIIIVILLSVIFVGKGMLVMKSSFSPLENFDELFVGNPENIENNLSALLPEAQAQEDKSIYLQIMSQIALAQAMQQKFVEAHQTLDKAESQLTADYPLAQARILLERGRVFHQAGEMARAVPFFKQSYEVSMHHNFDYHAINAAHMVPMAIDSVQEKIEWNKIAIALAEKTSDTRSRLWLGSLYNNLAQNYVEAAEYEHALEMFEKCKEFAQQQHQPLIVRGAEWGIARSLRSLGKLGQACEIQQRLLQEWDLVVKNNELPEEFVRSARGMVNEELAEIHLAYAKQFAQSAYDDLSKDAWCVRLIPDRLERMKRLQSFI